MLFVHFWDHIKLFLPSVQKKTVKTDHHCIHDRLSNKTFCQHIRQSGFSIQKNKLMDKLSNGEYT